VTDGAAGVESVRVAAVPSAVTAALTEAPRASRAAAGVGDGGTG
jgi:hypothetical protein